METPKEETIEYWVYQASKGENMAKCWQEIYRIIDKQKVNNLSKVNRIEVINHTSKGEQGRAYTYWEKYGNGIENPKVSLQLQDDGRTLKVFIEE